jgi:hypothetical protein
MSLSILGRQCAIGLGELGGVAETDVGPGLVREPVVT